MKKYTLASCNDRNRRRIFSATVIESLELRQLLSAAVTSSPVQTGAVGHVTQNIFESGSNQLNTSNFGVYNFAGPILEPGITPLAGSPIAGAYTPIQVTTAYGVNSLGVANEGQGVTIGIVDELDDPDINSDANVFSAQYGLPKLDGVGGDPTLTVYKDTTYGAVASGAGTGVGEETSLDVEWAHAMAPKANILLVEVPLLNTDTYYSAFNELLHGVQYAAGQPGVVDVSLSYGAPEADIVAGVNNVDNVTTLNNAYLNTGAAANVPVTVSSGDGSTPLFPGTSPNVIAVGGTSLYFSTSKGKYAYETAWGGLAGAGAGGGGLSSNFTTPTFQSSSGVNFGARSIPDVSLDADPVTAVSIYDSFDASLQGGSSWTATGGTSVAAPLFAGMLALAQQNRVDNDLPILNSTQINTEMYSLYNSANYATYFNDITLGKNANVNGGGTTTVAGHSTTTGYDLATGIGSPIANTLIPTLSTL